MRRAWVVLSLLWVLLLAFQGPLSHRYRPGLIGAATTAVATAATQNLAASTGVGSRLDLASTAGQSDTPLTPPHRGRHDGQKVGPVPEEARAEVSTDTQVLSPVGIPTIDTAAAMATASVERGPTSDPIKESLARRELPARAPPISFSVA